MTAHANVLRQLRRTAAPSVGRLPAHPGVPRYRQVAAILERETRDGTWLPGKVIPSQTQLAQRFGIAKATAGHRWASGPGPAWGAARFATAI